MKLINDINAKEISLSLVLGYLFKKKEKKFKHQCIWKPW